MTNLELGRLLTRLINLLKASRDQTMQKTMRDLADELHVEPDTIYKWRRGRHTPDNESLEKLTIIGVTEVGLDRHEAGMLLHQHSQKQAILNQLFSPLISPVKDNLPRRSYFRLVGRDEELNEACERLTPDARHWLVPIEGIGGVGKSTLALAIGWWFKENYHNLAPGRRFDAIIWASAKREYLTTKGIHSRKPLLNNVTDVYQVISDVLGGPVLSKIPRKQHPYAIKKALRQAGRVLIILDNLETVNDPEVLAFLRDLPNPTKAVATMRFHEDMPYPLRLRELGPEAARLLIEEECLARNRTLLASQIERLQTYTRGLPLAIWLAVGLMDMEGYSVEKTLDQLKRPENNLLQFIFTEATNRLETDYPAAHDSFLALSFFEPSIGASLEALAATSGLEVEACHTALQQLLNMNLVNRTKTGEHFAMLPLTRHYALAELAKRPDFDALAFDRFVEWVVQSTSTQTKQYWGDDVFEKAQSYVMQAEERIWLLNASTKESGLEQELGWLQQGKINVPQKDSTNEQLLERVGFFRRQAQHIRYYNKLIDLIQHFNGQFQYLRIVQCPAGEITLNNIGYFYIRHLNSMVGVSRSAEEQGVVMRVMLYEAQPRRNKTFIIIDRRYIVFQENEEIDGCMRAKGLRVICDPSPEVLQTFEFIFSDVLGKSSPASPKRIRELGRGAPKLGEMLRGSPLKALIQELLIQNTEEGSRMVEHLLIDFCTTGELEIQKIMAEILADLAQNIEPSSQNTKLVNAMLQQTNDSASVWSGLNLGSEEVTSN